MSQGKFDYVKMYELDVVGQCLPNCWIVIKLDGKLFGKFTEIHNLAKPNDARCLNLMMRCATLVMEEFRDISLAYGQSDEFSFVFRKDTNAFNRRSAKILCALSSLFSASFVYNWLQFFGPMPLQYPPIFDAQIYVFPTDRLLRDFITWRQLDVHTTNLYNTAYWGLVLKKYMPKAQAEERLLGKVFVDKNDAIFKEIGINYSNEPVMFRRGTILLRKLCPHPVTGKLQQMVIPFHTDLIGDTFWKEHPEVIGLKSLQINKSYSDGNEKRMKMDVSPPDSKQGSGQGNNNSNKDSDMDHSNSQRRRSE